MQVFPSQLKNLAGTWAAVRHIPPSRILARLRRMRRTRRLLEIPESSLRPALSEQESNRAVERLRDSRLVSAARRLAELTASTFAYDAGTATVCFRESGDSYTWNDIESIPWNDMKSIPASDVNRCFFIGFVEHASLLPGDAAAHLKSLHSYVVRLAAAAPIAGDRLCIPWQPMTAARRIINLLCALSLILDRDPSLARASELGFLLQHLAVLDGIVSSLQEDDLAYNHLASQLFARSLYSWVFDSQTNAMAESSRFIACVEEQVGADGMQMERSATYQAHVLGHVEVLRASGLATGPLAERINSLAQKMKSALAVITHPDGSIAVLNDAAIGDGPSPLALGISPASQPNGVTFLRDAGYARIVAGDFSGVFDAGPSGPDDNPGHAHADFLSLELLFRNQLLLADPGVATYKAGVERDWTRSASTHNGPTFFGLEPLEFLGPFRIGRRGKAHFLPPLGVGAPVEVAGWQDGFDRFGGRVARCIGLWPDAAVMIVDVWKGIPERDAFSSFLIPDSWQLAAPNPVNPGSANPDQLNLTLTSRSSGDSLSISAINGSLTVEHSAKYFPYGPRMPRNAARITLQPSSGSVNRSAAFVVRSANSNSSSFLDAALTRCEALLMASIENAPR